MKKKSDNNILNKRNNKLESANDEWSKIKNPIIKESNWNNWLFNLDYTEVNWKRISIWWLSLKEVELAKENPIIRENIINFKETLKELWLEKLWLNKDDIFKILSWKIQNPNFNKWNNLLEEKELKLFLINILLSLKKELNIDVTNLENQNLDAIKIIIKKSQENKWKDIRWTFIESNFMKKFIDKSWRFRIINFSNSLDNI